MKIGLVFGSTTGNTQDTAEEIHAELSSYVDECMDIDQVDIRRLTQYEVLLVGIPTWDVGGLQDSWDYKVRDLRKFSFAGVRVAFFGQGDQTGYPDNFQDAMGILRDEFLALGATADIGHIPTEGYDFIGSKAVLEDRFVGLALDEHNQRELTKERIQEWCAQLRRELHLTETRAAE